MSKISIMQNFSSALIYLLPLLIITGNFLPDLAVVIINILFITILIQKNLMGFILKNKYFWISLAFYLYLVVRSIFTLEWISIKSAFFSFRFILFVFAFYYLYMNKVLNLKYFYLVLSSLLFILLIDATYQYIFKINIFGQDLLHPNRVSSFFGDELILGSYTLRVLLLILPLWLFIYQKKINFYSFLKLTIFLTALSFLLLFSGERIAFFLFLIYILFLAIYLPKKFFNKLIFCFIFLLIIFSLFNLNDKFSKRLIELTNNNLKTFVFKSNDTKKNFLSLSKMHDDHYASGMKMFKDNILFGQGVKMFRIKCKEKKFNVGNFSCSTHPHNIIIQFFAELGIIGILFLIYFYATFFLNIIQSKNKFLTIPTTFLVILIFFPLLPYGNFFSNGLAIMNILSISILWCLYNDKNRKY